MVYFQVAHCVHHDLLDEGLDPVVVVEGSSEDVGPDVLVHGGVLIQELLNGLPVYQHHLAARLVFVADVVILEERSKVLWITTICTGEGEEDVEHPEVLQLGVEFHLVLTPVTINRKNSICKIN